MKICVCGGGNLGHVVAGFLAARSDTEVSILTRKPDAWAKELLIDTPDGTLLQGPLQSVSALPEEVVAQADIVLLCLPGYSIASELQAIKPSLKPTAAVGTVVSSTGFFFEARKILPDGICRFGFQRVPFIARTETYGHRARLMGYKQSLAVAIEDAADKEPLRATLETLFHTPVRLLASHYEASLSNSNPLLHPARLYDLWDQWEPGKFYDRHILFYEEWTDRAAQLYIDMDRELQTLLGKLPVTQGSIPDVLTYYESRDAESLAAKLRSIEAFKGIKAPMKETTGGFMPDLESRYFTEDIPYGLAAVRTLCHEYQVPCPTIDRIYAWADRLMTFRRQQLRMLDILLEVDRICRRHQIPYWLSSGTLIGALRHDGFIPWDDDLDIEMMREDYQRLLPLLQVELPAQFVVQTHQTDPNYCFFYAKVRDTKTFFPENNGYDEAFRERGLYIDIFPLEPQRRWVHILSEKAYGHAYKLWQRGEMRRVRTWFEFNENHFHPLLRRLNKLLRAHTITSGLGIPFHNPRHREDIFPLATHTFEGHPLPVPHDADHLLRGIYGDYMKLPAEEKRTAGHSELSSGVSGFLRGGFDVAPVLILFFNRPRQLAEVFAEVRRAQPPVLFLYQDGPRSDRDLPGIEACRKIVEDIDWPCEVHRWYQEENQGCDPSEYLSQKWAFLFVDRCIVLEDDDVPSQSFFRFCTELLDRYADNGKVWMISGFNAEETTPLPAATPVPSYFFTTVFSIWGWASWRRVIDTWDEHYTFLDDKEKVAKIQMLMDRGMLRRDFLRLCREHRATGKAHYETIFWASMILHDALAIMPARNIINNRGVTDDSTHYSGSLATMPRPLRRMFTMPRYEISFPLVHPQRIEPDEAFRRRIYRMNAWNNPWRKVQYSLEEFLLNLRYGHFSAISKALRKRIGKTFLVFFPKE